MKNSRPILIFWSLSLLGAIFFMWLMAQPHYRIEDMIRIEFATDCKNLEALLGNYPPALLHRNLRVDYAFIFCYSFLFYMSVLLFWDLLRLPKRGFLLLAFLPGLLDVIENVQLARLKHHCVQGLFDQLFMVVRVKWGLVIPFFTFTIVTVLYLAYVAADKGLCLIRKK